MDKQTIMKKVKAFPSMPGSAAKLLKLLDDPNSDASQVEEVLRYDPGLTANILKLTNSAYFGLPNKIGSVRQAVVMLGWKRLSQLVMTTCVNAVLSKEVPGYDLPPGELWRHSIAVSVTAETLCKEMGVTGMEEVFTAALLHDLGKLVLGQYVKDDLAAIESAAQSESFEHAEQAILGTNHAEIGAAILTQWAFPDTIVEAVRWHHEPDLAPTPSTLGDIVHVANMLCLMLGVGVGREGLNYAPSPAATKRLGLKTRHLELVASRTLKWIEEMTEIFNAG